MSKIKHKNIKRNNYLIAGQSLVLLLIFVMIAISITAVATFVLSANSLAATTYSQGVATAHMAETGAEVALVKILRDQTYVGETLVIDEGTVVVTVSGTTNLTITATATNGNFTKTVEVLATYSNNVLTPTSWKEIN